MVCVQNISKVYKLYNRPADRLLELLPFGSPNRYREFWALQNVSFSAAAGEIVGIVGPNGSGKSTLLQVVCGIVQATGGRVSVDGRIAALLELGAGFNPEFTGRENVYLNAEIMGFSRREADRVFPQIERFAEIGQFIDRPVKEYSSGMYVRLAFATAIHVEPDVLIVDEALAVGDAIFANRCIRKLEDLKNSKTTILFVSHDLGIVKRLCHRAILMVGGRILTEGPPSDVVSRYIGLVHDQQQVAAERSGLTGNYRHGDRSSTIEGIRIINSDGREVRVVQSGDTLRLEVEALAHRRIETNIVGLLIRNRLGFEVFGTNTRIEGVELGPFDKGETFVVRFSFACTLARGEYTLTVATQHPDGSSQDWLDDALTLEVADETEVAGVVRLPTQVSWDVATRSHESA